MTHTLHFLSITNNLTSFFLFMASWNKQLYIYIYIASYETLNLLSNCNMVDPCRKWFPFKIYFWPHIVMHHLSTTFQSIERKMRDSFKTTYTLVCFFLGRIDKSLLFIIEKSPIPTFFCHNLKKNSPKNLFFSFQINFNYLFFNCILN